MKFTQAVSKFGNLMVREDGFIYFSNRYLWIHTPFILDEKFIQNIVKSRGYIAGEDPIFCVGALSIQNQIFKLVGVSDSTLDYTLLEKSSFELEELTPSHRGLLEDYLAMCYKSSPATDFEFFECDEVERISNDVLEGGYYTNLKFANLLVNKDIKTCNSILLAFSAYKKYAA
jgi:hypothetical protein